MAAARKILIVNADDFGYFPFVTRGILEGIDKGVITATGILANSETFFYDVTSLKKRPQVDVGVHLNLTFGIPLTASMRRCLNRHGGHFAGKWRMVAMLSGSAIARKAAYDEIKAQVWRCMDEGLEIRFLNSHEHVHLLPYLSDVVQGVAEEVDIRYIRRSGSERRAGISGVSPGFKGRLLDMLTGIRRDATTDQPQLLGLGCSGSLTSDYLGIVFPQLTVGRAYELMCHPGQKATDSVHVPRRLEAYHDWIGENSLLVSSQFRELLASFDIELTGFRDLQEKITN